MIILAPDTGSVHIDAGAESVCVRHPRFSAPHTDADCTHVLWGDFIDNKRKFLQGKQRLIVVGLSRLMTPSNRVKLGQTLLRPIPGVERMSIDNTLFISEPWRLFWQLQCMGVPYMDFPHSFYAETKWHQSQEGMCADPFTVERLAPVLDGLVRSTVRQHFTRFEVRRVNVSASVHEAYAAEKAIAFDEEHTPAAIIRRLATVAARALPERAIPTKSALFASREHTVVQTDLRVDDWLVGELQALVGLANGIAEACYDQH